MQYFRAMRTKADGHNRERKTGRTNANERRSRQRVACGQKVPMSYAPRGIASNIANGYGTKCGVIDRRAIRPDEITARLESNAPERNVRQQIVCDLVNED